MCGVRAGRGRVSLTLRYSSDTHAVMGIYTDFAAEAAARKKRKRFWGDDDKSDSEGEAADVTAAAGATDAFLSSGSVPKQVRNAYRTLGWMRPSRIPVASCVRGNAD